MGNIVYFEFNSWAPIENYPNAEPFRSWMGDGTDAVFLDENFVKQNKLCVSVSVIDMSVNFCITATKNWVRKNCPELLTKHKKFLQEPGKDGIVRGRFGNFLKYGKQNIGIHYE